MQKKWYEYTWAVRLLLIILWPVGLYGFIRAAKKPIVTMVITTLLYGGFWFLIFSPGSSSSAPSSPEAAAESPGNAAEPETSRAETKAPEDTPAAEPVRSPSTGNGNTAESNEERRDLVNLTNLFVFGSYVRNTPVKKETNSNSENWRSIASYNDVMGNWVAEKIIPVSLSHFDGELTGDSTIGVRIGFSIENQKDFVSIMVIDYNTILDDGIAAEKKLRKKHSKKEIWEVIAGEYGNSSIIQKDGYRIIIDQIIPNGFLENIPAGADEFLINDKAQMKVATNLDLPGNLWENNRFEFVFYRSRKK